MLFAETSISGNCTWKWKPKREPSHNAQAGVSDRSGDLGLSTSGDHQRQSKERPDAKGIVHLDFLLGLVEISPGDFGPPGF